MTYDRRRSRYLWLLLVVVLVLGAGGPAAAQQSMDRVRLSYGDNIYSVIPTAGLELGIFAKYGLAVNAFPQPRSQLAVEALIGGSTDFAVAVSNRFIFSAARNLPLVAVGLGGYGYVAQVIVPVKDQTTKDMHDLVGKRVGIQVGSGTYAVWVRYLETQGLSPSDFQIVNLDTEVIPSAFEAGQLDAAVLWHPFTSQLTYTGLGRVVLKEQDIAGPVQSTYPVYLLTRRQLVDQRPELVQRFLLAWTEAAHWVETHRNEALGMMEAFYTNLGLELDQKVIADMLNSAYFDRVMISDVDVHDAIENIAKTYLQLGRIQEIPDLEPFIDNRFARAAEAKLGLSEPFR